MLLLVCADITIARWHVGVGSVLSCPMDGIPSTSRHSSLLAYLDQIADPSLDPVDEYDTSVLPHTPVATAPDRS
jgi:hypothetical protein